MNPIDRLKLLRSNADLQGARRLGEEVLASGECDDNVLIPLLIDIYLDIVQECHRAGVTAYLPEIEQRIDALSAEFQLNDRQAARRRQIRLTTLPEYAEIRAFDELSVRDGCEREAYEHIRAYLSVHPVDPGFHEMVATIFYRYLRACYTSIESTAVRRVLADYLSLAVPKPSRVHSLMLRMAVRASRRYPDFNFTRFFKLWNPRTLRPEDIEATGADGRPMMSLAVAALTRVIDSPQRTELSSLLELIPASRQQKAALMRDTFYILIRKALEAEDKNSAIELLTLYSRNCSMHTASERHSALLSMALRAMADSDEWRFPEFFINWDPSYLRTDDFHPQTLRDGREIHSLASRAISRCFNAVKADVPRFAYLLPALLRAFDAIADAMPDDPDELLERRRALLLSWAECDDSAVDRMCALARRPDERSARFWLDFADILQSRMAKMSVIALGILRTDNTSADAAELRLALAQLLHFDGRDDNAALELKLYTDALSSIAAEPAPRYGAIAATIDSSAIPPASNELLYHTLAAEALELIYSNIPSQTLSVVETDGSTILLSGNITKALRLDSHIWPIAARLHPGATLNLKIDSTGRLVAVRPLDRPPYDSLPLHYGIIVGDQQLAIQCAGKSQTITAPADTRLAAGQTVTFRVYRDSAGHRRAIDISPVDIAVARRHFDRICIATYSLNDDGSANYSAGPDREGGNLPAEYAAGVAQFTPIDLYYYRNPEGIRIPVSTTKAIAPDECPALKTVSGPLHLNASGQGAVRDVAIPADLLAAEQPDEGTYLEVTAVYIPRTSAQPPYWRAITIATY